jgi:hypothetical protein
MRIFTFCVGSEQNLSRAEEQPMRATYKLRERRGINIGDWSICVEMYLTRTLWVDRVMNLNGIDVIGGRTVYKGKQVA